MNVINEMVSDIETRKIKSASHKKPAPTPMSKRIISWQASSSIILFIGIAVLSYAIWSYNNQPKIEDMVKVAEFSKPETLQLHRMPEVTLPVEKIQQIVKPTPTPEPVQKKMAVTKPETPAKTLMANNTESNATPKVAKVDTKPALKTTAAPKTDTQKVKVKVADTTTKKPVKVASKKETKSANVKSAKDTAPKKPKDTQLAKNQITPKQKSKPKTVSKKLLPPIHKTIAKSPVNAPANTSAKTLIKPDLANKIPLLVEQSPALAPVQNIALAKKPDTSELLTQKTIEKQQEPEIDKEKFEKQSIKFSNAQEAKKQYAIALTKLNAGEITDAKILLEKTLELKNSHVAARKTLAGIFINEQDLPNAKNILNEGINIVPEASIFYHWLARIHMEKREFDKAASLLISGSKHAKDGEYFALLALAQQNTTDFKSAVDSYRQALSFKPTESKWWLGLGIVLEKSSNWKEAEQAYMTALKPENLPFFLHNQTNKRLVFVKNQIALAQNDR